MQGTVQFINKRLHFFAHLVIIKEILYSAGTAVANQFRQSETRESSNFEESRLNAMMEMSLKP
jgi:hypothetical protein